MLETQEQLESVRKIRTAYRAVKVIEDRRDQEIKCLIMAVKIAYLSGCDLDELEAQTGLPLARLEKLVDVPMEAVQ